MRFVINHKEVSHPIMKIIIVSSVLAAASAFAPTSPTVSLSRNISIRRSTPEPVDEGIAMDGTQLTCISMDVYTVRAKEEWLHPPFEFCSTFFNVVDEVEIN